MAEPAQARAALGFGVVIPFVDHLGIELLGFEEGTPELAFAPRPEHLNSLGMAHGGATMTLLDVAMATAARSVQMEMAAVTIEMKTSFMRPARGRLIAKGRMMQRTATMAFTEASLYDDKGRLCAHATGTFKYVLANPA